MANSVERYVSDFINYVNRIGVCSLVSGAIGYGINYGIGHLGTRMVISLPSGVVNPLVGAVCGTIAGVIPPLFLSKYNDKSSVVIGMFLMIVTPLAVCHRTLNLPLTFEASLFLIMETAVISGLVYSALQIQSSRQKHPSGEKWRYDY